MMEDVSKVSRLKALQVQKVISIAKRNPMIKRMIIFGSSVTDKCSEDSDIDICLDVSCDTKNMQLFYVTANIDKACEYNCDILFYNKIGEKLREEVDKKGVVVYEA